MTFSKEKNGYSIAEVDAYIKSSSGTENDRTTRIEELKAELSKVTKELEAEKQKRELIGKAIYNAVAKADQIEKLTKRKYEQDMEHLKAFHEKWVSYYNRILTKYPFDDDLKEMAAFNRRMSDVLCGKDAPSLETYLEQERDRIRSNPKSKDENFNPVEGIKEFLKNADAKPNEEEQTAGAFSLQEALNPTDDLSTIMRDLGFDIDD